MHSSRIALCARVSDQVEAVAHPIVHQDQCNEFSTFNLCGAEHITYVQLHVRLSTFNPVPFLCDGISTDLDLYNAAIPDVKIAKSFAI